LIEIRGFLKKSYCIECGKEKKGIEVEEDAVLGSIRWLKRNITKNEKGNVLVVCKGCYADYKKGRKKYESRQRIYMALGVIFVMMSMVLSPNVMTLLISLLVLLLLYFFSLLSYTPKINIKK
jgi:Ca2+/Na+ antiporter